MTNKKTNKKIQTQYGKKTLVRCFGVAYEYAETMPTTSAPNGEYWVFNLQKGWIPVSSNSRAFILARQELENI